MTESNDPQSSVSVVVVSDYEDGENKLWKTEELILTALANQDFQEPFEVLLVESEQFRHSVPQRLYDILPSLKIAFLEETQSAKLKDYGARISSGALVAVLEADCIPCSTWLRVLVEALRNHPEVSVASGRTTYGDHSTYKRALSLLDRGFDDFGRSSLTPYISNNGALYRRQVLEQFPYCEAITPFLSSRLRNQAMREAGYQFFFEPQAVMQHAIGGWDFVRDFRRNTGYSDMMSLSHRISYGEVIRLLMRRLRGEWHDCKRLGKQYLQWYDWPFVFVMLVASRFLEIPGMLDAIQKQEQIPKSAYR